MQKGVLTGTIHFHEDKKHGKKLTKKFDPKHLRTFCIIETGGGGGGGVRQF